MFKNVPWARKLELTASIPKGPDLLAGLRETNSKEMGEWWDRTESGKEKRGGKGLLNILMIYA